MDTLVSVGVLAAWLWSVYALFAPDADTYFETASVITTFILAGRYLEARAKRPRRRRAQGAARARRQGRGARSTTTGSSAACRSSA